MKLVIISDTHTRRPEVPDGDILIHCGDHTFEGKHEESMMALAWLNRLPHKHKIFIAGNHEVGWETAPREGLEYMVNKWAPKCVYLENSGVEIEGLKFWGSPNQPHFYNWAFQKARGKELKEHWAKIPDDTDILITHGPPFMIRDTGDHIGDEDLRNRVFEVKPKLHCFGHAHEGYGVEVIDGITFVNAAILNDDYNIAHPAVVIDL